MTAGAAPVLYVHVGDDGGLLVIDDDEGRPAWVTEADLVRRVDALAAAGGSVLLSTEDGSRHARPVVSAIEARVPVRRATQVHPDAERRGGLTALMRAAYVGASLIVDDLLRRGIDVDAADERGYTALMYAANAGEDEIVAGLVAAGANLDAADATGATALMFAAQHGHASIVKRLLAAGADPSLRRSIDGATARDVAESNGHSRVAAVLLSVEQQRR
ncbi:MAG TPA: ankyrin repeat domain-containing protein [Acidimicrobiales bacterium]|nr:ankyrin repeat domain-containing protein [Acidimicrobiales bacterium]